ncbi:C-type lectin domain family 4 member E-like [Clarias gariepinus]|uniref:C-type lectin domain family 4 member E-like n=1 Tax=Clarias gariepinus TaxID=13013 RepID=UPI00234CFF68|nr:C-type lectin domain family 4 member E-like [Clarias gariepinus]
MIWIIQRTLRSKHRGDTACSKCYRLTAVCVVLLCVLLLTAVTVLWIKYNILYAKNSQLQTIYNNLIIERDQLQRERDGWRCFSSSLYFMSNEYKSWTESREDCKERGADLVIINSTEEQQFINTLVSSRRAWIGLSDRDTENKWKWVDDTPLITGFWGYTEPDSAAIDKNCVIIGDTPDPMRNWANYPCNNEFIWICEKTIFN